MHWPNPYIPLEETLDALLTLQSRGKIRFIGLSNFAQSELERAISQCGPGKIVSNQVEYNLSQRTAERGMLDFCKQAHVTLLAYSPLGGGSTLARGKHLQFLKDISNKYEKSAAQIALRWLLLRRPVILIVKSSSHKHTLENAEVMRLDLEQEDIDTINREFRQQLVRVPPSRIRVGHNNGGPAFRSIDEAMENKDDLVPAPQSMALNLQRGNAFNPLGLMPLTGSAGWYDYELADNESLYWAWVIAKGIDEPMPAYVRLT